MARENRSAEELDAALDQYFATNRPMIVNLPFDHQSLRQDRRTTNKAKGVEAEELDGTPKVNIIHQTVFQPKSTFTQKKKKRKKRQKPHKRK